MKTLNKIHYDGSKGLSAFADVLLDKVEWGQLHWPIVIEGFNPYAADQLRKAFYRRGKHGVRISTGDNFVVVGMR